MKNIDSWVDAFISTSFRDVADEDYLAARMAYRHDLLEPFLWLSLHAVEKYLKATLLFNRRNTKKFGHDVVKSFADASTLPNLVFPPDIQTFINYIEEGPNRYGAHPTELRADALVGLDRTVWHLRRFCYPMARARKEFADEVAALGSDPLEYRHRFRIPGGYLEKVLAKPSDQRRQLVWKNFWFGSRRRRKIKSFSTRLAWRQPVHFMRPEVFAAIESLVHFEKNVKAHFNVRRKRDRP